MRKVPWEIAVVLIVACAGARVARGDFLTPANWNRGDAFSTYQQWETFASPAGPNAPNSPPLVPRAAVNPNGAADVVDTSGGSFVTGGGNIYSPTAVTQIDVTVPEYNLGAGYVTTVILQTRTQGTEANYGTIRLTYSDGATKTISPVGSAELFRQVLGGFGGSVVDRGIRFEVPYSPGSMLLEVDAAESSMSLDRVLVDTIATRVDGSAALLTGMNPTVGYVAQEVPEPGLAALSAMAALVLGRRRK